MAKSALLVRRQIGRVTMRFLKKLKLERPWESEKDGGVRGEAETSFQNHINHKNTVNTTNLEKPT